MCGPPRYGHSWHKCLGLARIYLESFSSWEPVVRREFRRIVEPTSELGQECPPLFNALPASRRPVHRQAESLTRARLGQTPRSEADGAALVSGNSPPVKGYTRVMGEPPAIEIALTRAGLSQTVGEGGRTFVSWCYRSDDSSKTSPPAVAREMARDLDSELLETLNRFGRLAA